MNFLPDSQVVQLTFVLSSQKFTDATPLHFQTGCVEKVGPNIGSESPIGECRGLGEGHFLEVEGLPGCFQAIPNWHHSLL